MNWVLNIDLIHVLLWSGGIFIVLCAFGALAMVIVKILTPIIWHIDEHRADNAFYGLLCLLFEKENGKNFLKILLVVAFACAFGYRLLLRR